MNKVNYKSLRVLFSDLGVKKGRIVMVHGFMPSLGRIEGGYKTFYQALSDSVGDDGGVIVPTFTYSFTKGEVYDVQKSKSTVGDFTNYFIENNNFCRNLEPIFSMAGVGKEVREIINNNEGLVFGKDSIYEKIEEKDVLFLLLGIDWDQGLSYFMHLESSYGVSYRYNKDFKGEVVDYNGNLKIRTAVHCVRDYDMNPIQYRGRIGKYLEKNNIAKVAQFGYGTHRSIGAQTLKNEVFKKLESNRYYLLREINGKRVVVDE